MFFHLSSLPYCYLRHFISKHLLAFCWSSEPEVTRHGLVETFIKSPFWAFYDRLCDLLPILLTNILNRSTRGTDAVSRKPKPLTRKNDGLAGWYCSVLIKRDKPYLCRVDTPPMKICFRKYLNQDLKICFWKYVFGKTFFNFFLTFISLFEKAARKSRLILDLKILPSAD